RSSRGETGNGRWIQSWLPHHYRVAFYIDTAPSGATCQLSVLPRCDVLVGFAVEFHESFNDHRASRHIDTQCQGLGCKDHFYESRSKELFDDFFEQRQQTGVVGGETAT